MLVGEVTLWQEQNYIRVTSSDILKSEKNRQHAQSLDGDDDNNDDTRAVIYFVVT